MLKIVVMACALLGILCAVSLESWLRRHVGNKEIASDVYTFTLEKYSEFWIYQIAPTLVVLVITGLILGFGIGINHVIAYAAGAVITFISVYIGSRSFTSSVVSSSSMLADGDLKGGMRSAFRGGAVIGLVLASFGIAALGILFIIFKQKQILSVAAAFALGVSIAGVSIRLSGSVLTASHKLSDSKELNVDFLGAYASNGAEFITLMLISACSSTLLSEVGVESSGVTSSFSASDAARFPIIILACGIVASVIGIFIYRPYTGKYSHFGITACSIVAGAASFGAAYYFSNYTLESPVYAYCIGLGILAQLASAEFCKSYSMDSQTFNKNLPRTKDEDIDIPMINGLSIGFISSLVPGVIIMIVLIISFKIANYYGIALAAIGANSIAGVNLAVRNFATSLSASTSFAGSYNNYEDLNTAYFRVLRKTSSKAKAGGRAYSAVSEALTLTALLTAFSFTSESVDVVLSDPLVFGGIITGTVLVIVLLGLLVRAILISTNAMLETGAEDPEEYRNITSVKGLTVIGITAILVPLVIGFVLGKYCVTGLIAGSIVTAVALILAFNNSGRYYDRISSETLGSVIVIVTTVALAAVPAFIQFGAAFF